MSYLIHWIDDKGELKWGVVNSLSQAETFIEMHLAKRLDAINYDEREIYKFVHVFEVSPNYQFKEIKIKPPSYLKITLR